MNKPNRHKSHILETESSKFFINQVPNEWFVDKPDNDYGLDFITNIVINNNVTGLNFSVQLKSKQKEADINYVSIKLKRSTLGLYNTRLEPVLLVAYVSEEKEAYWTWFNDLILNLTTEQSTITVKISKAYKLSSIDWNAIVKYVQKTFSIKTLIDGLKSLEYDEISNSEVLAWKHYYSGEHEKAAYYFKNILEESPNDIAIILEGLSHSQYMSYNYKEALLNINKAIELSGTDTQLLNKACILAEDGITNRNRGRLIEAKNIFLKLLERNHGQYSYHYNLANTLRHLGEMKDSLNQYEISLKLNPNNAEAWKNLGSIYFDLRKHDEELACYDKALKINPSLPQALFSKGITLSYAYNKHQEGLDLMIKAIVKDEEMIANFPRGYFWLAYANEKLNKLKDSIYYINKGLSIEPEDIYFLEFKSNFLANNWKKEIKIKEEAITFFEYRLNLDKDLKSLFYLIQINEVTDNQAILTLIQKYTSILKSTKLETLEKCNLNIKDYLPFLLNYDKYLEFRHIYSIDRYINSFLSDYYSVPVSYFDLFDLISANSFSKTISKYYEIGESEVIAQTILENLSTLPNIILELIPEENFTIDIKTSIMANVYLEFPLVVVREFAIQNGYLVGKFGLEEVDSEKMLPEAWFDDLQERTLIKTNERLKLLREE